MMTQIQQYLLRLNATTEQFDWAKLEQFAEVLLEAVNTGKRVYLCGNGGSAGNAMHLANDFLYGIAPGGNSLKVEALAANTAVLTCLGNDIGYDNIFSHQIKVKGESGDILIALSGSGNSPNILNAIEQANQLGMRTCAILGYQGGKAKDLATYPLHFAVDDMQIAEDLQLIVGHMLMQYMNKKLKENHV